MSKKNIVIIGPAHPLRGGLASYNERLAKEFKEQGHEVSIVTFSYQYPGFLFPGTTQYSTEPAPNGLSIQPKINSINPINWFRVGNELKQLAPYLIVVRYWLPFMAPALGTILRRVKKNRKTKIVCIADNVVPHEKRPGDAMLTRYFVTPVDAFITMSEKVLADLKTFAPNKPAQFVPHPLYDNFGEKIDKESARKHLQILGDVKIILFFGFIRKYKGLDLLLQSMKILQTEFGVGNLRLLIAGEFYEDEKNYEDLINDPIIKKLIIPHTKFIADSDVKYYFSAADCVVQPYRNATQSGVTPLAYHFEKPMIVTNVGGLPAMVPDHQVGLIAEPNALDLAEKIIEYFTLGENFFLPFLQEEKKKYRWSVMTDAILNLAEQSIK